MAFAGLKKQINKANQYVTEKMGGAEGTKLDMDFMEMERKTDVTVELVEELQVKTKEYLQPNPTARAKMAAVKGISKLSGQAKSNTYPQPEGLLADCMLTYGKKLGDDSVFAMALIEFGESLKQMADVKYSLDDNIKQNFLEPLHHLQTKDLKEVMHHRKKLQGRRLDFDCKRRRQAKDDEIRSAEDKFAESLHLAQMGMYHLLENDVEQISQLVTFSEALYEYHSQCSEVLKVLQETLQQKREEAESRPKAEFVPKTLADLNIEAGIGGVAPGTDGGAKIQGITRNGHGIGITGGRNDIINGCHYPPSRFKQNNMNSHHQLYSSQQDLYTNANNNNINSSKNNVSNKDCNNSKQIHVNNTNFSRNRVYGSQQSLSSTTTTNNNNNTNSNYSKKKTVNADLDSSYDWLNAWNNPPPKPPSASSHSTNSTTFAANKQINFFNNNSRTKAQHNDPWKVTKPTHLELDNGHAQARSVNASPLPSPMRSPAKTPAQNRPPCCTALYDFEPENPGELGFKENDTIQLLNRVDENWYEGSVNGRTGYFPQSYVQVLVPLPN